MADILIVEDDKELADLLTDFLRDEGYTVSSTGCGERALQLLNDMAQGLWCLTSIFPM